MKLLFYVVVLSCALLEAKGYPHAYRSASGNVDTWSYSNSNRGGLVLSRSYNPRTVRGASTTHRFRHPQPVLDYHQLSQYHLADRRRQALLEVNDTPPQQNEVYYPQPEETAAVVPIEATELVEPVEKTEAIPTIKTVEVPTETEEVPEEPVQKPRKAVSKKKVKRPVVEEDDEDESYSNYPELPTSAFFPMFFGWGGKSGSSGATAIANAFSTGKGGVATSDAVAYGTPRPEQRL